MRNFYDIISEWKNEIVKWLHIMHVMSLENSDFFCGRFFGQPYVDVGAVVISFCEVSYFLVCGWDVLLEDYFLVFGFG
jgi:hypothetical protein